MSTVSSRQGYLAAFGAVAIWTGFNIVSRIAGKSALAGTDMLALRVGVAALILLLCGGLPSGALRDARLWLLTLLGGLGVSLFAYSGFKYAPAAHGGLLLPGMQPFLVALFAWWLTGERLRRHKLPGYALIGAGLALSAAPLFAGAGGDAWIGDLLLLLASLSWAAFGVLARRWAYPAWPLTRAITIMAAMIYLPIYLLWLPKHLAAAPWPALLFQAAYQGGAAAIVAMLLYLRAIAALGAVRVGMLFALIPVLAGLLAVPLLDEPLTGYLAAGLVCVSLGAWLAAREPAVVAAVAPAACGAR
ncbi:drug/metabolite transporter (DMT)-like permease [Chromobacterium alkanivorans]|uniref:DMT family transporter n=1 Tax=Chromobacterium alkanivorans TaxID=1071719 RepID=UPI002167CC15|nr:DMT family transporter [Chromobacterium alkanivorans]MCS3803266.1 drug/metabolite transporter (DMT)-like permease [Chromobacterium alkanivorans]MCS3817624.1 drug/metabolite transporter (DMT)-like permease [Chromobacterium alkanivorans]MCS3872632.1 drug/metabolite transporter (DMT)-like permease [Chromobacterium alkanivorans]